MRVPYGAGPGPARVTLSYPGLEGWDIRPATMEVPFEEVRWRGRLLHYGPRALGAALAVGVVWWVLRRRVRAGRIERGQGVG